MHPLKVGMNPRLIYQCYKNCYTILLLCLLGFSYFIPTISAIPPKHSYREILQKSAIRPKRQVESLGESLVAKRVMCRQHNCYAEKEDIRNNGRNMYENQLGLRPESLRYLIGLDDVLLERPGRLDPIEQPGLGIDRIGGTARFNKRRLLYPII